MRRHTEPSNMNAPQAFDPNGAAAARRSTSDRACARSRTTTRRSPIARSSSACSARSAWQLLDELRERAPHRPLGAHAVRSAGRHLGRAAQSLPAGRPARQPQAPAQLLVEALHHRLNEIDKRAARPSGRRRRATRKVGELLERRARGRRRLRRRVSRDGGSCASARGACSRASHAQGQHHVRRPARACRT